MKLLTIYKLSNYLQAIYFEALLKQNASVKLQWRYHMNFISEG